MGIIFNCIHGLDYRCMPEFTLLIYKYIHR